MLECHAEAGEELLARPRDMVVDPLVASPGVEVDRLAFGWS